MTYSPKFNFTPELTNFLIDIESSRQAVSDLPITVKILTSLRESARLATTHYSTQIEGNRLTQNQVEEVVKGGTFPNRNRDEREVKHYYIALDYLEGLLKVKEDAILEKEIQTLHGLVMYGKEKATPYRDGQNVIKDGSKKGIIYMPPEAKDVPKLMNDLINWVRLEREKKILPAPLIAGITHYQFVTIHPYYDGNGRTARLLTNLILHRAGYGLKGIYSLEEYYAKNLHGYYDALTIGESHNYYFAREESDISKWINYFCAGMANAFASIRSTASKISDKTLLTDQSSLLRELDQRQRKVLSLFMKDKFITTSEIAQLLGVHQRTTLNICNQWVSEGFLIKHGTAKKTQKYELSKQWIGLIG